MAVPLVRLEIAEIELAADILDECMREYPTFQWIFSGHNNTAKRTWFWRALARYSFLYGEVWADEERSAVAMWLPPGAGAMPLVALVRSGLVFAPFVMGPRALWKLLRFQNSIDALRKKATGGPHWYLFLLGTRSGRRKLGVAKRLVDDMAGRADKQSLPCFLETQFRPNVFFYEQLGFKLCGEMPVRKHGSLKNFAMIRVAAQAVESSGSLPDARVRKSAEWR